MNPLKVFQTADRWYNEHRIVDAPYWITQDYLYKKLDTLKSDLFKQNVAGESTEKRPIRLLRLGSGKTPVLMWSQMHGDEPTATRALLDLLSIIQNETNSEIVSSILDKLTLYILPMLNPDGTERFTRRTAAGIDMNRDALALRTPEARILKSVHDNAAIQWAYSLHDQESRYTAGGTGNAAGISLLAAATDWHETNSDIRRDTMRLASCVAGYVQNIIPGRISRYDDAHEPRAFGDAMHAWGTRTLLIESGYIPRDRYKETVRKVNTIAILGSLYQLAQNELPSDELYHSIPDNRKYFAEYIFKDAAIDINGRPAGNQDVAFYLEPDPDKNSRTVSFKMYLSELGDCTPFTGSYIFRGNPVGIHFTAGGSSKSGLPETDKSTFCEIRSESDRITVKDGIPSTEPEKVFHKLLI